MITSGHVSRGTGNSGPRIQDVKSELSQEVGKMAETIWHCIRDVYDAVGCAVDESHRAELKQLFDTSFREAEQSLPSKLDYHARIFPLPVHIADRRFGDELAPIMIHARNKQYLAIDMHLDKRLQRATGPSITTISNVNIHGGHVGVLQTGQGSVASISGGLSDGDQAALLDALNQVIAAILRAPSGQLNTASLLGVAAEATEIIKKPDPDKARLREVFDILALAVQAIGSAPQAYAAVQAALAMFP